MSTPVRVISREEARALLYHRPQGEVLAIIREQGWTPFVIYEYGFDWVCPGCGAFMGGNWGESPAGGWDAPRWVNSGTADKPTLAPSLGCVRWRDGTCPEGHYWLRDGVLEPA